MVKSLMLVVTVVLLSSLGCTKTLESTTSTEVYPNNPYIIQRVNVSATLKTTW